jgi:hypothetical protein
MPFHDTLTTTGKLLQNNANKIHFQIRMTAGTGGKKSTVAIEQAPQSGNGYRDLFYWTGDGDVDYEAPSDSHMRYRVVNNVGSTVTIFVTLN